MSHWIPKPFLSLLSLGAIWVTTGCTQEMANQRRVQDLEQSNIFANSSGPRQLPANVMATAAPFSKTPPPSNVGQTEQAGKDSSGTFLTSIPSEVIGDRPMIQILQRGQSRFGISCVPCHDRLGNGNGMVPERGYPYPPTYHNDRLRAAPLGYFYYVITNGHNRMPAYANFIQPNDRWAIASYIRALQLSQYAPAVVLSSSDKTKLAASEKESNL